MSETLNNIYIDSFLRVAFAKYILSQIRDHVFRAIYLGHVLFEPVRVSVGIELFL